MSDEPAGIWIPPGSQLTEGHTDITALSDEILLVAALDFGTTYSGIAWSFTREFEKYPLRINSLMWSPIVGPSQATFKTPTVLLLKSNKEVIAFGYAAEEQYEELADDDAHHGYYFFRNFKMLLYDNEVIIFILFFVKVICYHLRCIFSGKKNDNGSFVCTILWISTR